MTTGDELAHLKIPDDKKGQAIRNLLLAQYRLDGSLLNGLFSEDVVFNGLIFKLQGKSQELEKAYSDFIKDFLVSYRVDSIAPAVNDNQCMFVHFDRLKGNDEEVAFADLITFDQDSKICRIDNCFDVSKVGQEIHDDAKRQS